MNGDGHGHEATFQKMLTNVPNSSIFIDVGANMGAYTIFPAVLGVKVLSFEVMSERVREIRLMAALNGITERVQLVHGAISELSTGFLVCKDQRPDSVLVDKCFAADKTVEPNNEHLISAPFVRMDNFVSEDDEVYIVKVDCDGCEEGWFRGSQRFLKGSGMNVAFFHLEVQLHAKWLTDFEHIMGQKKLWFIVTEFHGHSHLNPNNVNSVLTAAKAKNEKLFEKIPNVHQTLSELREAVYLIVPDASNLRVDLLVVNVKHV